MPHYMPERKRRSSQLRTIFPLFPGRLCHCRKPLHRKLKCEPLEDRSLLAATISVGDHILLPDTADQKIDIFVSGGDAVAGVELFFQIADGGPEVGGSHDGPAITAVDILTDTIFDGVSTSQTGSLVTDQVAQYGTTTDSGSTTATGLLATLTVDTTGFTADNAGNPWELRLGSTLAGNSSFPGVTTLVIDGTISIAGNPTIITGHHFLLPDTPDQQIEIYAEGGGDVSGAELFLQVADGGRDAAVERSMARQLRGSTC